MNTIINIHIMYCVLNTKDMEETFAKFTSHAHKTSKNTITTLEINQGKLCRCLQIIFYTQKIS